MFLWFLRQNPGRNPGWPNTTPLRALTYYFAAYLLASASITAALSLLRRRLTPKE